jgi:hypothetical protein
MLLCHAASMRRAPARSFCSRSANSWLASTSASRGWSRLRSSFLARGRSDLGLLLRPKSPSRRGVHAFPSDVGGSHPAVKWTIHSTVGSTSAAGLLWNDHARVMLSLIAQPQGFPHGRTLSNICSRRRNRRRISRHHYGCRPRRESELRRREAVQGAPTCGAASAMRGLH